FGEGLLALGGGEYAAEDLVRPHADWVRPLGVEVWGRRVWTVPPASQGYLSLAGAWIAERLELPDPADGRWAHLLVEAARQAAFDRGDVLHEHADGAALIASERLEPRLRAIDPGRAARLGDAYGGGGTIFLCALDEEGTGVSLIQSNFWGWGSLLVVPGVRIFLQNRGSGFSLVPGHPAEYGPGRRPPHTLSPALVTRPDGSLDLLLGSMGGDSQPQIVLQLLVRRLAAGEETGEAIAAPRWVLTGPHPELDTWAAGGEVTVRVEAHAPPDWFRALERRGHRVERAGSWEHGFGEAHAIAVGEEHLAGASDPRSLAGAAAGY
ncbi:MAG: gamma-glutamyltransferase, partial [Actinobacteria bacterium]|nr:gamma-glutamyltransferase [Actinomycetota bacterium]